MPFTQIIGQSQTIQNLLGFFSADRVPHAIMLSERPGSGALPLAIAFAQYIMCANKTASDSCGTCANCIKISRFQHPDVHFSFPVIKPTDGLTISDSFMVPFREHFTKHPYSDVFDWLQYIEAGNKQGNISTKECHQIIQKLQLRSYEGGKKILIMWLPEYLGNEGNILLKLIEEPPKDTIMIFVTQNYDKIISTIQSRTQLITLNILSFEAIYNALIAEAVPPGQASQIAHLAENDYHQAQKLLLQDTNTHLQDFKTMLNGIFTNQASIIMPWVQKMADLGRENQKQYFSYCLSLFEHLVRFNNISQQHFHLAADEISFLEKLQSQKLSYNQIELITNIIADAQYHIERNVNAKILFHSITLKLKNIIQGKMVYL